MHRDKMIALIVWVLDWLCQNLRTVKMEILSFFHQHTGSETTQQWDIVSRSQQPSRWFGPSLCLRTPGITGWDVSRNAASWVIMLWKTGKAVSEAREPRVRVRSSVLVLMLCWSLECPFLPHNVIMSFLRAQEVFPVHTKWKWSCFWDTCGPEVV